MKSLGKGLLRSAEVAFFIGVILTILSYFGNWYWAFDDIRHFRPLLTICFLLYVGIPILTKGKKQIVLCIICFLLNLFPFISLLFSSSPVPPETEGKIPLRILQSNVLTSNTRYQALLDLIQLEKPDIILLQEPNQAWVNQLAVLDLDYPIHNFLPREDNYGIAIYAKTTAGKAQVIHLDDPIGTPIGILSLPYGKGQTLTCFSVHAPAPYNAFTWKSRNIFMRKLASRISKTEHPILVTGDFNNTPYSNFFEQFVIDANLCDTTKQFALHPTWPSFVPRFMRIQLDHCLHSRDITILEKRNGPKIGSDHLPVIIDLLLPHEKQGR